MSQSLLIMLFGQSNADAHNAGPGIVCPFLDNPKVVVPNDGRGFQGLRGHQRTRMITGFEPSYRPQAKIQSIGAAIGCRLLEEMVDPNISQVVVRSAARGGRPLHGYQNADKTVEGIHLDHDGSRSYVFETFLEDVRQIQRAAHEQGRPLRQVYIPFFHGEADRSLDGRIYHDRLTKMMSEIDAELECLGLDTTWLLTQPAGTTPGHNGNRWQNRLCLDQIARERPNAYLAAANYGYKMADCVHLSAESKALVGEHLALQIARLERGLQPRQTRLAHTIVSGRDIDLIFDSPCGMKIDTAQFPLPDTMLGFSITGQKGQSITQVRQTGPASIRLTCDLPVAGNGVTVDYAYQQWKSRPAEQGKLPYALGRGCLREDWSATSKILFGRRILSWVPAFSAQLATEMPVDQPAAVAA